MIPTTTTATILIVDDNAALGELMEVILCSAGYEVLSAGNGTDALWLARNTPQIDLLVSDLEMPAMRGEELARRFSRLHPSASVLFVSSSPGPIGKTPPCQFLPKPFTMDGLRTSVRGALRTRSALAETSCVA